MIIAQDLREVVEHLKRVELPIATYLVDTDGRFLFCNRQCRKLLGLPPEGEVAPSILDFYAEISRRDVNISRVLEAEDRGESPPRQDLHLKINRRDIFMPDHAESVRKPDREEVIGFLGCLADLTAEERLRKELPAGVYRLDADDTIVYVNDAFVKMLGYESPDELIGRKVEGLYADPVHDTAFEAALRKYGQVVDYRVELVKRNGETVFFSANTYMLVTPEGGYAGREGILTSIDEQVRLSQILEQVPLATYEVRIKDGVSRIVRCNEAFKKMFEFGAESPIGVDDRQVHGSDMETARYQAEIEASARTGKPIVGFKMKGRTRTGRQITMEVNTQVIVRGGQIIGRTGVLRDITEEEGLRESEQELTQTVKELVYDIGSVLHAYTSTLLTARMDIDPALHALGPDPFGRDRLLPVEEAATALVQPARNLAAALERLLAVPEIASAVPRADFVIQSVDWLRDYDYQIPAVYQPTALRERVYKLAAIFQREDVPKVAASNLQELRRAMEELLRIESLVRLHWARDEMLDMDRQVLVMRDFVTSGIRVDQPRVVADVNLLIQSASRDLLEWARRRGVDIRFEIPSPYPLVEVVERDVIRALGNLLHNAVKYSWSRESGRPPWVLVWTRTMRDMVAIEIQSYGVPVAQDEIEQDLIFQIGYRGSMSTDRYRTGTGIGLADARRVARDHGGNVILRSEPASPGARLEDYTKPFLTTATLTLPILKEK